MTVSIYSSSWYRISKIKPRLRAHIQINRHHYRGELWYVLQDHLSGKFHRFTPEAYQIIGQLDGNKNLQEIWSKSCSVLKDRSLTQDELINLLSQMHQNDLLQADIPPDSEELLNRFKEHQSRKIKQAFQSPLSIRIPILDPDKYLNLIAPYFKPIFSVWGFLIWFSIVGAAIFLAAQHWLELTQNITDRILAPHSLVMLWATFPFVKAFHELGHALALKTWGGEVHEIGIMFLVFTPVPYVDASTASAFREKRKRIIVGAGGIIAELIIASSMLFIWLLVEPGYLRSTAYNVMLIAGISTILFNGNPLLRYDGYYIFMDLIEIPNLWTRSSNYIFNLIERYLLGIERKIEQISTKEEHIWFIAYALLSFCYRVWVYSIIIILVASKFFFVGVIIAMWGLVGILFMPIYKGIKYILKNPDLRKKRLRLYLVINLFIIISFVIILVIPFPLFTVSEGVVRAPEQSVIRAGAGGFIQEIYKQDGAEIQKDDPLIRCYDPLMPIKVKILKEKIKELQAIYDYEILNDRVRAEIVKDEMSAVNEQLRVTQEHEEELILRSPGKGIFILPNSNDLIGKFVQKGELLGYVLNSDEINIRLVVPQHSVDLVRYKTINIDAKISGDMNREVKASLRKGAPAATNRLPSAALSKRGGGSIAADPYDRDGLKSFENLYEFDLKLINPIKPPYIGARVYIRFYHEKEPIGWRIYRGLRRLFLKRFTI